MDNDPRISLMWIRVQMDNDPRVSLIWIRAEAKPIVQGNLKTFTCLVFFRSRKQSSRVIQNARICSVICKPDGLRLALVSLLQQVRKTGGIKWASDFLHFRYTAVQTSVIPLTSRVRLLWDSKTCKVNSHTRHVTLHSSQRVQSHSTRGDLAHTTIIIWHRNCCIIGESIFGFPKPAS